MGGRFAPEKVAGFVRISQLTRKVDAYIADTHFRKRDPRFADQQEHKKKTTDKRRTSKARKYFAASELRERCIRGKKTEVRTVTIVDHAQTYIAQMIERFDTERGRHYYSRRMGVVEPGESEHPQHARNEPVHLTWAAEGGHAVEAVLYRP